MEFSELNRKRHKVARFSTEKVSVEAIKAILNEAHYAPSGVNMQTWHFVIVDSEEKKTELAQEGRSLNKVQIQNAPAVVVIFSDTKPAERLTEVLNTATVENETQEKWLDRLKDHYIKEIGAFSPQYLSDYLALNTGLVSMNLMYAINDAGYKGNFILGFDKTPKINKILEIDERYRPELIIVFGHSEEIGTQHYRLPVDKIIDVK